MVGRIIEQDTVRDAVQAEFAVLDHGCDVFKSEFMPNQLSVVASVGGQNAQFVEVSREELPRDLGIVRLFHPAKYIQDRTSYAFDQGGGFHDSERVIRLFRVVLALWDAILPVASIT